MMTLTRAGRLSALATIVLVVSIRAAVAAEADSSRSHPYSASAIFYILEDEDDYLSPTLSADHGLLHLEARYQYEDVRSASLWAGVTWSGGKRIAWDVTPMAGLVLGDTDGAAPGIEASVGLNAFEWYTEAEYLLDFDGRENDFFYMWSELSVHPSERWRIGLVSQRSRASESDLEVDRGPLVGASFGPFSFSIYAFNPDRDARFVALQSGVDF